LHVNAVCFDYPGYGFSGGSVGIPAIQSSALQEFDYVKQRFAPNTTTPIVSYGWSIGTSMTLHVAASRRYRD
jgi:pimeloyl-ACP methyl ester carboxylesterase